MALGVSGAVVCALVACAEPVHEGPVDRVERGDGVSDEALAVLDLAAMRWERRLLIGFAPGPDHPALVAQRAAVEAARAGVVDRDLAWIEVLPDVARRSGDEARHDAAPLRARFEPEAEAFTVVLVGLDGGEKLRRGAPIAMDELFAVIDAMPMRADELRERGDAP